jgi:hypothetical protein
MRDGICKMKKIILLHALQFLIVLQTLNSQQVSQEWLRKYNDTSVYKNNQYKYSTDLVRAMTNDNQGNIYIAGEISLDTLNRLVVIKYSPDGTIGWVAKYPQYYSKFYNLVRAITADNNGNVYVAATKYGNAYYNFLTLKFSSGGVLLWSAEYDGPLHVHDLPYSIAVDASGNVFVTGESILFAANSYDITTIKYNSSGVQQWIKSYDGNYHGYDAGVSVKIDDSGNIIVGGVSEEYAYSDDFVIIKYSQAGAEQWIKRYNYGDDVLTSMTLDSDGNIYATGDINPSASISSICVVKYSSLGNLLWSRLLPPAGNYTNFTPYALAVDMSGNLFIAGRSEGVLPLGDYITIKYNYSGSEQWIKYYDGASHLFDFATDMNVDYEGSCYVTGVVSSTPSYSNVSTVKYNSSGVQQWDVSLNSAGSIFGEYPFIAMTNNSSIYVGVSGSGEMDRWDFNLTKYHQVIGIQPISSEIPNQFSLYQNYPNPFNPATTINYELPEAGYVKLVIYDILGRKIAVLVNEKLSAGKYKVQWDASDFPSGVYFCKLVVSGAEPSITEQYSATRKLILLK